MRNKLISVYHAMKGRCCKPCTKQYKDYGGRGITICKEWSNAEVISVPGANHITKGFYAFKKWALENGYSEGLTIDRIDNDKGYSPDNCRWVSRKEQQNNLRCNHLITYKGRTQTMAQWCEELNLNYGTVDSRLNHYHWTIEKTFETPVRKA